MSPFYGYTQYPIPDLRSGLISQYCISNMFMIEYTEILCTTLSSRYSCISTVQVQIIITTLLLNIIPQIINNNVCSYKQMIQVLQYVQYCSQNDIKRIIYMIMYISYSYITKYLYTCISIVVSNTGSTLTHTRTHADTAHTHSEHTGIHNSKPTTKLKKN